MRDALTIRYRGLPIPYVERPENFFTRLLEKALGTPVRVATSPREHVDIALTSTHPSDWRRGVDQVRRLGRRKVSRGATGEFLGSWDLAFSKPAPNATVNIWTSGENTRPPVGDWDVYLSHDLDDFGGRNIYLPFWMEAVGHYAPPTINFLGDRPTLEQMLTPRETDVSHRPRFACAFLGKNSGIRGHAIRALGQLGQVDVFGPAVARPVKDKLSVARQYQFILCFENDLYPGYVTEKPFDAWATGAVPLYWGSDPAHYLNPRALMNLAEFPDLESFVQAVAMTMGDTDAMGAITRQPILLRPPDMSAIELSLREKIEPLLGRP